MIKGERVVLRTTTREDLPDLLALWNDGRVMKWVGFPEGLGYDAARMGRWFDWLQGEPHRHHFVVTAPGVGFCGEAYYAVDREHGRAALDIKFRTEAQGQGLATEALRAIIRHVFETEPEVYVVWTEPYKNNAASQALYARCGLKPAPRPADLPPFESFWALSRERWNGLDER